MRWSGPQWKPAKGTALLARRAARGAVVARELVEKAAVVRRVGRRRCRLVPSCDERSHFQTAHLDDKGMGGDHGERTSAATMLRACLFHHLGVWSLHSKDLRVEYLTDKGTDGPIAVWGRTAGGTWALVGRERAVGVWE
jgi:hypothetical protein